MSMLGDRRHPLLRIRYQLLGGLICAVGLPLITRMIFDASVVFSASHHVTVLAAIIAHMTGYMFYRRLGNFPGIAAVGNILPTFVLAYGMVFSIIFLFRLDYSRFQAIGSFVISIAWYFSLFILIKRIKPYRLGVVPGGDATQVMSIGNVSWEPLRSTNSSLDGLQGIVADLRADLPDEWERFIADCAVSGKPVYHFKQIVESLTGRIKIEHLSENTLGSLNPNHAYMSIKQAIDWVSALVFLSVMVPFLGFVALAIRLESSGPALFRQQRIGYRGQPFQVIKFRTMHVPTPSSDDNERDQAITLARDSRVTRIGRFLRRTRIDELPQLINVLRGEMSWIGPRPEAAVLSRWYEQELPFYRYRHIVRPGISGWAQVNQGHVADVEDVREKLHYDFYYIANYSPWLDIVIMFKTVGTMGTGFGAK